VKSELGEFLKWIGKNPPPSEKSVPFASEELESIKKNLQSIIIYHLEKEPKTLHYLNEA
jgi:DNA repair protein RecO (recombination protein O)